MLVPIYELNNRMIPLVSDRRSDKNDFLSLSLSLIGRK